MKNKKYFIIGCVILACLITGFTDAVLTPGYWIKSAIKVKSFLLLSVGYSIVDRECNLKRLFRPNKKGLIVAFVFGITVFIILFGSFLLFGRFFDLSTFTETITNSAGVNDDNFLIVTLYICLVNSFLEEFFFRGFAFFYIETNIK